MLKEKNKTTLRRSAAFADRGRLCPRAVVTALSKAGSGDSEKLVTAMEGMEFGTPKSKMHFRREDHQAIQPMYHFRIKQAQKNEWDLLELVREIPAGDMPLPIRNKR